MAPRSDASNAAAAAERHPEPADPIGVFDSGVGGLTVARELIRRLPHERVLYVADQAHVPYGGRPLEEVEGFATAISAHLFRAGAKAVVMACNISSATALTAVRARFGADRVLGVIDPGAHAAIDETRRGKIGVLATLGTVKTGAYTRALKAIAPFVEVTEVACPKLVPLVEAGMTESDDALAAAREYLAPILGAGADTVILGCTHYPFLLRALREAAGPSIAFVDPAAATVRALRSMLDAKRLLALPAAAPLMHSLATTGDGDMFRRQLAISWPEPEKTVEHVVI